MTQRYIPPREQVFDANGAPMPGAKLYFYTTATTTPKDTYSDSALTTPNANPVVADSAGRFGEIFLGAGAYKIVLKDSSDVTIWTADPTTRPAEASAFWDTVLDDTTAAAARTTLGAGAAEYPAKGTDIASAAALDLPASEADQYFDVTGTTTITSIEVRTAGREIEVRFTGALTLTHNATTLILPTSANITTVAGDVARFRSLGSGNWRCTKYTRLDGTPLTGVFSKSYASTGQTITAAGALTLAHGMGVAPKIIQLYLKCTSGELGYSTGDEVFVNPHDQDPAGTGSRGIAFKGDATNLTGRYGSGATEVFRILHATTGTGTAITNASWQLYVRAFA